MAMLQLRERWSPFQLLDEVRRDFEELKERLFGGNDSTNGRTTWRRAVTLGATDIYEHNGNLVHETELPGVRKRDINVRVEDNRLIVTGEVKRREDVNEENYFRLGRRYGRFQRVFQLPQEAIDDPKKIEARFEDGILRLIVPLKQSLKGPEPVEIEVK